MTKLKILIVSFIFKFFKFFFIIIIIFYVNIMSTCRRHLGGFLMICRHEKKMLTTALLFIHFSLSIQLLLCPLSTYTSKSLAVIHRFLVWSSQHSVSQVFLPPQYSAYFRIGIIIQGRWCCLQIVLKLLVSCIHCTLKEKVLAAQEIICLVTTLTECHYLLQRDGVSASSSETET